MLVGFFWSGNGNRTINWLECYEWQFVLKLWWNHHVSLSIAIPLTRTITYWSLELPSLVVLLLLTRTITYRSLELPRLLVLLLLTRTIMYRHVHPITSWVTWGINIWLISRDMIVHPITSWVTWGRRDQHMTDIPWHVHPITCWVTWGRGINIWLISGDMYIQ
jgi:hypothetical protein